MGRFGTCALETVRSERAVQCIEDQRVRGCGRWYQTPFTVRGARIVTALLCPECFEARLAAGDERVVAIYGCALERDVGARPSGRRHSGQQRTEAA